MTAALEGDEWPASHPGPQLTRGKDTVPILQEAGWAPGPVWTGGKSLPHRDSIPNRPVAIPTELPGPQTVMLVRLKRKVSDTLTILSQHSQDSETPYHHHSALIHGDNLASCESEFLGDANHKYDTSLEGYRSSHPVALPCCIPHSARLKQKGKKL